MRLSAITALLCGLSLTATSCSLFKPKDQTNAYDPYGAGATTGANPYGSTSSNPYSQQPSNPYGSYETPQTYTPPASNPYTQPADPTPSYSGGGGGKTHTVVRGDTLWGLSRRYNTTVTAIKSANNLSSDNVMIGQRLTIP